MLTYSWIVPATGPAGVVHAPLTTTAAPGVAGLGAMLFVTVACTAVKDSGTFSGHLRQDLPTVGRCFCQSQYEGSCNLSMKVPFPNVRSRKEWHNRENSLEKGRRRISIREIPPVQVSQPMAEVLMLQGSGSCREPE